MLVSLKLLHDYFKKLFGRKRKDYWDDNPFVVW